MRYPDEGPELTVFLPLILLIQGYGNDDAGSEAVRDSFSSR